MHWSIYSLIILSDNEEKEEEFVDADDTLVDTVHEKVMPQISLNALSGEFVDADDTLVHTVHVKFKELVTISECKNFQWQLYGQTFTTDVMLLPVGGCDMVLGLDLRIPLIPGTQPVNIRPYRHPPVQKDAIEAMIKELLKSGVIKHSQSSFASHVVMVKRRIIHKECMLIIDSLTSTLLKTNSLFLS
ncbi:hypothetical protein Tco_1379761 [Tanacetum coccineum]